MGRFVVVTLLVGCGRYGFDARHGVSDGPAAPSDTSAAPGDGPSTGDGSVAQDGPTANSTSYVGPVVQHLGTMGSTGTFMLTPTAAGDAVALMVGCAGSQTPSSVTVTAPGWTFTQLSPLTFDPPAQIAGASFGAIVPGTAPTMATVTWVGANCNRGKSELADEFGNSDPAGGTITFDAHAQASGTGNCATTVTTGNANDAVWAGCYSATMLSGSGAGYTRSASDGIGDYDEYKLTADPAGTAEAVSFTNVNGFVVVAATIKPR